MILLATTAVFLLLYAALIFYYRSGWRTAHSPSHLPETHRAAPIRLSLIIPARNEGATITPLLSALAAQSLPREHFEVIVVDDHSTDDTYAVVQASPLPLRLIRPDVPEHLSSKKKAIEAGVRAATGDLVVTTDADCLPGPHWLRSIYDYYTATAANFIAAPVKFTHDSSLFQSFQALDFLVLQGITAASVRLHFHAMCNGANLAYRRQSFIDVHGFDGIDRLPTGDDMLLMHKIWKLDPQRVVYLKDKDAIVETAPATSWKDFINQRKRWASKTFMYEDARLPSVLVFVYLFNLLFPIWLIAAFWNPWYAGGAGAYLILKTAIELPFVTDVTRFYGERRLLRLFPFFQPVHILYTVAVGWLSQSGSYVWKGRRTE